MKLDDLVKFVEKFILDFIGVVLPGFVMLGSLALCDHLRESVPFPSDKATPSIVFMLIAAAYIIGHCLHAIGEKVLLPLMASVSDSIWSRIENWGIFKADPLEESALERAKFGYFCRSLMGGLFKDSIRSPHLEHKRRANHANLLLFAQYFEKRFNEKLPKKGDKYEFHSVRSIALSVAPESEQLSYKFMFVSLMNLGVASALVVSTVVHISFLVIHAKDGFLSLNWISLLLAFLFGFVVPYLFMLKHTDFFIRSGTVPFGMAYVKLLNETAGSDARVANVHNSRSAPSHSAEAEAQVEKGDGSEDSDANHEDT